jgi:hypothetical protein
MNIREVKNQEYVSMVKVAYNIDEHNWFLL